jgi:hypothetical protein
MWKSLKAIFARAIEDIQEINIDNKVYKFLYDGIFFPEKVPRPVKQTQKFGPITYNFVTLKDGRRAVGMVTDDEACVKIVKKNPKNDDFVEVCGRKFGQPVYRFTDSTFRNI